jgi:hypothetical protein
LPSVSVPTALIGGSVLSAGIGAVGSISAADTQAKAENNALSTQQQMFNTAAGGLQPFVSAGTTASKTLSSLLNPGTAASTLSTLPGLQFQQQYGTMQTQNALAAQGLGGSKGPVGQALSQYNQGLASTYYNNYVSGLQNLTNTGSNAASALAGSAIQSGSNQAGNIVGAGNALASGTLGATNAASGAITSGTNGLLLNQLLSQNSSQGINSLSQSPGIVTDAQNAFSA